MSLTGQTPDGGNRAYSRALMGMAAPLVTVETHLPGGLPAFTLVGMPETAVRESRDRVKSAIQNCGLEFPAGRVVVNLAPAELAKEGARFDLAIAVSVLCATGQVPHQRAARCEFLGELGLFGELRATRGCLCAALAAIEEAGARPGNPSASAASAALPEAVIVPMANAEECQMDPAGRLRPAGHLMDVVRFLRAPEQHPLAIPANSYGAGYRRAGQAGGCAANALRAIHGQQAAKRALLVAAAGGHHMLLVGPPGTGKTMLAQAIQSLLPPLQETTMLEVAAIYSAAAISPPPMGGPPFRDPHHSSSAPALVGGGSRSLPGEISLAHGGVLFLDELPHFKPSVLNLLREPLESHRINIARAGYRASFPASFQLVAAMNPCPAGRICEPGRCRCSPDQVTRYQSRISGPLLDRIDLHVSVPSLPKDLLLEAPTHEGEGDPAEAVVTARAAQLKRQGRLNAQLGAADLLAAAPLRSQPKRLLVTATEHYRLSARSAHRVLRTARTVADLCGAAEISTEHLAEALSYRALDWEGGLGMAAG